MHVAGRAEPVHAFVEEPRVSLRGTQLVCDRRQWPRPGNFTSPTRGAVAGPQGSF